MLLLLVVVFNVDEGEASDLSHSLFLKERVGERAEREGRRHGSETCTMKEMHPAHPGSGRSKQKGT